MSRFPHDPDSQVFWEFWESSRLIHRSSEVSSRLRAFTEDLGHLPPPASPFAITIDQEEPPVDVLCRLLGEYIANQAHVDDVPTFARAIHSLRHAKSWMVEALRLRLTHIFAAGLAAVEAHNQALGEDGWEESG